MKRARALLLGALALELAGCRALYALLDEAAAQSGAEPPSVPSASQERGRGRRGRRNRDINTQADLPELPNIQQRFRAPGYVAQPGMLPGAQALQPAQPAMPQGAALLRVVFVDVGQGDAALLQSGDGHNALIDAGPPEGSQRLLAALQARGVTALDWVLLSHPHLDHLGGLRALFDAGITVGAFYDPGFPHPIATYNRVLATLQQRNIPYQTARQGQSLALGSGVRVEVLQPHEPFVAQSRSPVNANSVVVRAVAGNVRVLFTGDAESETEERLRAENAAQLQADVLKVAHHGSRFATDASTLALVRPRYAVLSCAQGNDYGHPHAELLQRLQGAGVQLLRTDAHGDVLFTTDGATYSLTPSRPAAPEAVWAPGVDRGGREPQ